jgi:hypothetical protein
MAIWMHFSQNFFCAASRERSFFFESVPFQSGKRLRARPTLCIKQVQQEARSLRRALSNTA